VRSIESASLVRVARATGALREGGSVRTRPPQPTRRQLYAVPGQSGPSRARDAAGDRRIVAASGDIRRPTVLRDDYRSTVARERYGTNARGAARRLSPHRERYAPVRLTRRGRLVARLMLVLTALLVLVGIAAGAKAVADPPSPAGPRVAVVVEPGDTLWSIAERHAPDTDRRTVIAEIRQLNDLNGSTVEVGQQLLLPRR
jgi:LysM repeat protein